MSLTRLFAPRGIAFVGATPDPQRYGGRALQYCLREGFARAVHVVNPKLDSIFGVPSYKSLADIPGRVDVVVVLVGPARIPILLEKCEARDVGFAVVQGDLATPGPGQESALARSGAGWAIPARASSGRSASASSLRGYSWR